MGKYKIIYIFISILVLIYSCKKTAQEHFTIGDCASAANTTPFKLNISSNFSQPTIPVNNPLTKEGVALGRMLFYDPALSRDGTISCGSCHKQRYAFTDSTNRLSTGIDGFRSDRNTMPIYNLVWNNLGFFWDGRAQTLAKQALMPIANLHEMGENINTLVARLNKHKMYPKLFKDAFGITKITEDYIAKALTQFETTLISDDSRFDRWVRKEPRGFLTGEEQRGMDLYNDRDKGACNLCHNSDAAFTTFAYFDIGLDQKYTDLGQYYTTLDTNDMGKFRTPSLRNLAFTSPYMHDGRFDKLEDILEFYNNGFHATNNINVNIRRHKKGRLAKGEQKAIIAFLNTLNDSSFITNPAFKDPNK
jgi:cytochrome c peroxidase